VRILKYTIVVTAGLTLSAHASTVLEFGAENLLSPRQNTPELNFQEVKAFAAGLFLTQPIFTGDDPRIEEGLNAPIELGGFGYAVVHYAPGTSGNPTFNRGGSLEFYFLGADACQFTFPQTGPGDNFSNGRITSVTLFLSEPIPDAGATVLLFAIALSGLVVMHRFVMLINFRKRHYNRNGSASVCSD
jgi:hypothetical protein